MSQLKNKLSIGSTQTEWKVCDLDEAVRITQPIKPINNTGDNEELMCSTCHIEMVKSWNEYNSICPKCDVMITVGVTGDHHTMSASENHNTSSNSYMLFKPVGAQNKLYHRTLLKCTSEYERYRDTQILQLLKQYNYINSDLTVPQNVLRAACEMFICLKGHDYVRRGKTRRGVLGACIYVQCQIHHVTKTKFQIAKLMQVEEAKITFGLEELQQYATLGVIEIPENVDPTADYIDTYFEIFDIPTIYKQFAIDLLDRMTKKKIDEVMQCFNTTKCIGVIFFLGRLLHMSGINHEQIAQNCENISRGTYLNVSNAITNNKAKLRKVFVRHNMPMPSSWTAPVVESV